MKTHTHVFDAHHLLIFNLKARLIRDGTVADVAWWKLTRLGKLIEWFPRGFFFGKSELFLAENDTLCAHIFMCFLRGKVKSFCCMCSRKGWSEEGKPPWFCIIVFRVWKGNSCFFLFQNEARVRHLPPGKNTEVLFQGKIEHTNRRKPKRTFWQGCLHKAKNNRAILIDMTSRVLFPLTFLAFNVIYWIMYTLLL